MSTNSVAVDKKVARGYWRVPFLAGMTTGVAASLLVIVLFGPWQKSVSEDPLTGHVLYESTWLGWPWGRHVEAMPHATWASRNSVIVPDASRPQPGQFGWTFVSAEGKRWFSRPQVGCGGGYSIPLHIFQERIVLAGKSREEVLQLYQTEAIAEYQQHGTMQAVQERWTSLVTPSGA